MNFSGLQRLVDSNQRVFSSGFTVYYQIENFVESREVALDLGRSFVPSTIGQQTPGYVLETVTPNPQVTPITVRELASAKEAGVQLRTGARKFTFSNTWVKAMQTKYGFALLRDVFEDNRVTGLRYGENLAGSDLYQIGSVEPLESGDCILNWDVYCNVVNV